MKRDWDLLRKQLTNIEEELNVLADIPDEPKRTDQSEAEFTRQREEYSAIEARILGHLELLIKNGYVEGIKITRGLNGHFMISRSTPRLTMAGHDLLDTMRSKPVWETSRQQRDQRALS
ncbi:DUF2513 domain-containing protein [Burkholderia sp. 9120]|uniref:DUF2513 domain-containing protein n=1 Tax=Burkholderia sp. 9120 TaxID=1500897 RepID=UPI000A86DE1C|nr:DUF2513 domain-containing protein [Burkholderia sp. 9120]